MNPAKLAIAQSVAVSPMFPPSFEGSPGLFGLALACSLTTMMLAASIIVRLMSRMRAAYGGAHYVVTCLRLSVLGLLWAIVFGTGSDVLTWLFWGEVDGVTMGDVMLISRLFDALRLPALMLAVTVTSWVGLAMRVRLIMLPTPVDFAPVRADLAPISVSLRLAALCFISALGVTILKWWAWHAAHHI